MQKSSRLIIFCELPETGKSTLAESTALRHRIPLFGIDRLEAAIVVSDLEFPTKREAFPNLGNAGLSILSVLSEQHLILGQSVILDSTGTSQVTRDGWGTLANKYEATLCAIHCICSYKDEHRRRIKGRKRNIPGWYELTWLHVLNTASRYDEWKEEHLVCDSFDALGSSRSLVDEYIGVWRFAFLAISDGKDSQSNAGALALVHLYCHISALHKVCWLIFAETG